MNPLVLKTVKKGGLFKRIYIFSSTIGSQIKSAYFVPRRNEVENTTWNMNHNICNWNWAIYGSRLSILWIEEDGGSGTRNVSVSAYGINISVDVHNNDDEIGSHMVLKTDSKYTLYDVGCMRWYQNF